MILRWIPILMVILSLSNSTSANNDERGVDVTIDGKQVVHYADSRALVIGVDAYPNHPDVKFAENDAREVGRKLKSMGFNVDSLFGANATKANIEAKLLSLGSGHRDSRVVVYFAGHGATREARSGPVGYILPVNAVLETRTDFITSLISMGSIKELMDMMSPKHVLLLLDCCWSGSVLVKRSVPPEYIDESIGQDACYVITAGDAHEELELCRDDHSLFAANLLEALDGKGDLSKDGYLRGTELALYLYERVVAESSGSQHPQYGSLLRTKGDFVFRMSGIGWLSLMTNSDDAGIFLGDKKVGTGQVKDLNLKRGVHQLTIEDPNGLYESEMRNVTIEGGEDTVLTVNLRRASGTLNIESNVSGADVRIDGAFVGHTPLSKSVDVGEHSIEVSKTGYHSQAENVRVYSNQGLRKRIDLSSITGEYYSGLHRWRTVLYTSLIVTAASGAAGTYFFLEERNSYDQYLNAGPADVVKLREQYENNRKYKQISLGVLGVSVLANIYSYMKHKKFRNLVESEKLRLGFRADSRSCSVYLSVAF